jgi:hypothetical protein
MIHEPGSLRARLRTTADQALRLNQALEATVPYRQVTGEYRPAISRQRRVVAPIPWNSVAAELTLEFHSEIRRLETHLKERVTGGYLQRRGSSDDNTRFAVDSVVNLCETIDDNDALGVLNYLTTWVRRAETHYNPAGGLRRLPREPGEAEMACPYCQHKSMRWQPSAGIAVCVRPACHKDDGQRPRWLAEYTLTENGPAFRWEETKEAA